MEIDIKTSFTIFSFSFCCKDEETQGGVDLSSIMRRNLHWFPWTITEYPVIPLCTWGEHAHDTFWLSSPGFSHTAPLFNPCYWWVKCGRGSIFTHIFSASNIETFLSWFSPQQISVSLLSCSTSMCLYLQVLKSCFSCGFSLKHLISFIPSRTLFFPI